MDIARFNKILGDKIKKANAYEGQKLFNEAIKLWIEISEMALRASQDRSLNVSYRSMLIKKTEQIVAHVKEIKPSQVVINDYSIPLETSNEEFNIEQDIELPKIPTSDQLETKNFESNNSPEIIEDSEIRHLPIGFKEIKPSKDIKILTPHDPTIVKKRIEQAEEMDFSVLAAKPTAQEPQQNNIAQGSASIKLEQYTDGGDIVCFACGSQNSKNSEQCKDCGTKFT